MIHTSLFTLPKQLVRLWRNEFTRVICDRLTSEQVRMSSCIFFFFLFSLLIFVQTRNGNNQATLTTKNGKKIARMNSKDQMKNEECGSQQDSLGVGFLYHFLSLICLCLFSRVAARVFPLLFASARPLHTWNLKQSKSSVCARTTTCFVILMVALLFAATSIYKHTRQIIRTNRFYLSLYASNIYLMRVTNKKSNFKMNAFVISLLYVFRTIFFFFLVFVCRFFFCMLFVVSVMFAVSRPVICHSALCSTIGGNNACVYMLLLRLQTISATINGNKRRCVYVCVWHYIAIGMCCGFTFKKNIQRRWRRRRRLRGHDGDMLRSKRLKLRQWIARKKRTLN